MKKEYVIWGITATGTEEQLLVTTVKGKPITDKKVAEEICQFLLTNHNCKSLRLQTIDFNEPLDFTKTIK